MMHGDYEKRRYRKITIWSCKSLKFIELLLGELQIQLCINYGFWKANKSLFKIDAHVDKFGWYQFLYQVEYSSTSYNFSLIALMYKWLECNRILKSVAIVCAMSTRNGVYLSARTQIDSIFHIEMIKGTHIECVWMNAHSLLLLLSGE